MPGKIEKIHVEKISDRPAGQEKLRQPEKIAETTPVAAEKTTETTMPTTAAPSDNAQAASQSKSFQARRATAIDNILSEGLNEIFLKMTPPEQQKFKLKGDETVQKINILLGKTRVQINKILNLIRAWLKLVPGINKFFLEQEAKIKTDKIMNLKDKF